MKTVLITGGSRGIGRACAEQFLAHDCCVIITGRNEERLFDTASALGERCRYLVWDAADTAAAPQMLLKAHDFFGDIDTFVNNAGIVSDEDMRGIKFIEKTEGAWDETMNINLKGMFFGCQAEARYMIERRIRGHIVNVCSEMGFRAAADAYRISKWGVRGLTMGLGVELAKYGIICNGIAPGETATEIFRTPERTAKAIRSPRGQRAMPEEIAEAITFLASSNNIIGEILVSDGGRRLMI